MRTADLDRTGRGLDGSQAQSSPSTSRATILLAGLGAVLLAGCDSKPATQAMPEVNDANCELPKIMKIEDDATRRTFGSLCSRRSAYDDGRQIIRRTENPLTYKEMLDLSKDQKSPEAKP